MQHKNKFTAFKKFNKINLLYRPCSQKINFHNRSPGSYLSEFSNWIRVMIDHSIKSRYILLQNLFVRHLLVLMDTNRVTKGAKTQFHTLNSKPKYAKTHIFVLLQNAEVNTFRKELHWQYNFFSLFFMLVVI